jgi:transcriptional regulator with XRE-family HTH domain
MTQSELADKLNVTRQAISKYEVGDSFPDISILLLIAETFGVTLDVLIHSSGSAKGEAAILQDLATGCDIKENIATVEVSDLLNVAPYLRPSILEKVAEGLIKQGIDITSIVALAQYMNDESVLKLLENASYDHISEGLLEKLMPFLDDNSKNAIFEKILDGKLNYHMIRVIFPYAEYLRTQIEAAVVYGVLDYRVLDMIR